MTPHLEPEHALYEGRITELSHTPLRETPFIAFGPPDWPINVTLWLFGTIWRGLWWGQMRRFFIWAKGRRAHGHATCGREEGTRGVADDMHVSQGRPPTVGARILCGL